MSSSTEWAWPSAITTTMASPTSSSLASARAGSFATPAKELLWTPRVPAASSDIKASALPLCGLITTATACLIFHNRGNATLEDVTATSGIFDSSSKSLGVAMFDYDRDGWPDLLVANDTQPNKLYRNLRNGKFKDVAVEAGLAFSTEGKARAGMGVDTGDFDGSARPGIAITNFDNEMIGLYRATSPGIFDDVSIPSGLGAASRNTLGFGCMFLDVDLDGALDLAVANGHIDETVRNIRGNVGYAQPPQLFLNSGTGNFRDVAGQVGGGFESPKVGRGLAFGDFDRDGDLDILLTTNNGPAYLYRNDREAHSRSIRFYLQGTKSNRDGVGASGRMFLTHLAALLITANRACRWR